MSVTNVYRGYSGTTCTPATGSAVSPTTIEEIVMSDATTKKRFTTDTDVAPSLTVLGIKMANGVVNLLDVKEAIKIAGLFFTTMTWVEVNFGSAGSPTNATATWSAVQFGLVESNGKAGEEHRYVVRGEGGNFVYTSS